MVGVDVLTQQRELAGTAGDEAARLAQDVDAGPALLRTARVGNHAEGAELVAAFLDGQERADAAGRLVLGQTVELALDRELGVDHRAGRPGAARQQLGQAMIGLRADDDIDEWRTLHQELALGLRHAARHGQHHLATSILAPCVAQPAQAPELGIHLLRRLLADVAGVQHDEVGVVGGGDRQIAVGSEGMRHTIGIVDVHLAAVGLDVEFLGHVASINRKHADA